MTFGLALTWTPRACQSQSFSELADGEALLVAPAVAFAPAGGIVPLRELTVRYSAWFYHSSEGGRGSTAMAYRDSVSIGDVAITAGYIGSACRGCTGWLVSGAEWQRPLWSFLHLRLGAGVGAPTKGKGSAASFHAAVPVALRSDELTLSLHPALYAAGVEIQNRQTRALRPGIGATARYDGRNLTAHIGGQYLMLKGSGFTIGGGAGWRL